MNELLEAMEAAEEDVQIESVDGDSEDERDPIEYIVLDPEASRLAEHHKVVQFLRKYHKSF